MFAAVLQEVVALFIFNFFTHFNLHIVSFFSSTGTGGSERSRPKNKKSTRKLARVTQYSIINFFSESGTPFGNFNNYEENQFVCPAQFFF